MLMFFTWLQTKFPNIFENSDHITKRMVPVGNGYDHENASIVSTTTVSYVTTTETIAQSTTNKVERGLVVAFHTTKKSRRRPSTTHRSKF